MNWRELDKEQFAIDYYRESNKFICEKYSVSVSTVNNWARRLGLNVDKRNEGYMGYNIKPSIGWSDEEVEELLKLSVEFSIGEIAEKLGRSYNSVKRKLLIVKGS